MADTENITEHLTATHRVWDVWKDAGFTAADYWTIDFRFYVARKDRLPALLDVFNRSEIPAFVRKKRMLLLWEGHEAYARIRDAWTLESVQDRVREFVDLARQADVLFEGVGAWDPSDGDDLPEAPPDAGASWKP